MKNVAQRGNGLTTRFIVHFRLPPTVMSEDDHSLFPQGAKVVEKFVTQASMMMGIFKFELECIEALLERKGPDIVEKGSNVNPGHLVPGKTHLFSQVNSKPRRTAMMVH
jgi:hypothetical protein